MPAVMPTSVPARARASSRSMPVPAARRSAPPPARSAPADRSASGSSCPCGGACPRCDQVNRASLIGPSTGETLSHQDRRRFETDLRQPLGDVRLHREQPAASRLGARAVTLGRDIAFAPGEYRPGQPEGDRLIAHELAHTIQQRHTSLRKDETVPVSEAGDASERSADAAADGRPDPLAPTPPHAARDSDIITEDPWAMEARLHEARRRTIGVVRDPIIDALRRRDPVDFLNRLRSATDNNADREILAADPTLREALEREFAGSPRSLWISRRILQFGRNLPEHVRAFETAVRDHDTAGVVRYLRAFDDLRKEHQTPGVRDWLTAEYRGRSDAATVLGELTVTESLRMERPAEYRDEVHYETNATTGNSELQLFTATEHYDVARTAGQVRVIMRMKLVQGSDATRQYYPETALADRWLGGIQSVWNNRIRLTNGTNRLDLVFVPVFTSTNPHHTIAVRPSSGADVADRADAGTWYESDDANTAAHEFGHFLGNQDEYNLPGSNAEVPVASFPRLDADELHRSTWEGIYGITRPYDPESHDTPTIMGASHEHTTVELRHVSYIVGWFNSAMLSPGEAAYRAVFR